MIRYAVPDEQIRQAIEHIITGDMPLSRSRLTGLLGTSCAAIG
jgi:hypothetical protein